MQRFQARAFRAARTADPDAKVEERLSPHEKIQEAYMSDMRVSAHRGDKDT